MVLRVKTTQVPFGHTQVAFESLFKGLGKLLLDETAVRADLNNNWAVTAEAIQTILRREGVDGLISTDAIYLGTLRVCWLAPQKTSDCKSV